MDARPDADPDTDAAYRQGLGQVLELTGDEARIRGGLALISSALKELRCARGRGGGGPVPDGAARHHALQAGRA